MQRGRHEFQTPVVVEVPRVQEPSGFDDFGVFAMDKDTLEAVPLAAVGAVRGVYEVFVKPELTANRGWLAVAGLVTAYELTCPPGETLSEGADRALQNHRLLTLGAIAITAGHLANVIPQAIDPFSRALKLIKR